MTGSLIWTVIANINLHFSVKWTPLEWFIVAILFLAFDLVYPKPVAMWYAVGALFSTILCLLGVSPLWQLVGFVVMSFIALIVLAELMNKFSGNSDIPDEVKNNLSLKRFKNKKAVVIKAIKHGDKGLVKVFGLIFPAISSDGTEIKAGTDVIVVDLKENLFSGVFQYLGSGASSRYVLLVKPLKNHYATGGGNDR